MRGDPSNPADWRRLAGRDLLAAEAQAMGTDLTWFLATEMPWSDDVGFNLERFVQAQEDTQKRSG